MKTVMWWLALTALVLLIALFCEQGSAKQGSVIVAGLTLVNVGFLAVAFLKHG